MRVKIYNFRGKKLFEIVAEESNSATLINKNYQNHQETNDDSEEVSVIIHSNRQSA